MNNNLLRKKIELRLNKLSSVDFDNIECWMVAEAFNKAQIEWVRRQLQGTNLTRTGAEQTVRRIDDLQPLLTTFKMTGLYYPTYWESCAFPDDFLQYTRVATAALSDCCPERPMRLYLAEESQIDLYLVDELKKPDFDWGESFFTFFANRVRIYTNGEFKLSEQKLIYYRKPRLIEFDKCMNPSTGLISPANVECEFKDDVTEVIIDDAAAILAGDIEHFQQMQRLDQAAEQNN